MANLWHTCDTLTLCKPPDYAWKAGFGVNTTFCEVTCDDTGDWSDQFIWLVTSDWRSFTTSPSQSSTIWTLWVPKDDLYLWRKVPFPKKVTKNAWRSLMEKEKTDHHDGHHCALKTETRRQTFVYYWILQQWWVEDAGGRRIVPEKGYCSGITKQSNRWRHWLKGLGRVFNMKKRKFPQGLYTLQTLKKKQHAEHIRDADLRPKSSTSTWGRSPFSECGQKESYSKMSYSRETLERLLTFTEGLTPQ